MKRKGINAYALFAATLALIALAALLTFTFWGVMMCLMIAFVLVAQTLILRFTRPSALKRTVSADHWQDRFLPPFIALCAVASAVLSLYDTAVVKVSIMPFWCILPGIVLLLVAYIIFAQAVKADAPHAAEKYGEAAPVKPERGPYDVVRYPVMLSVMLGGISIPLFMGSGIGFIPAGFLLAAAIALTAFEDEWRFNNYEWYYDYTKEVSYRLIPFIW
jgi:protein-S-isoprenylcysteine O-methyltransferase Ste14